LLKPELKITFAPNPTILYATACYLFSCCAACSHLFMNNAQFSYMNKFFTLFVLSLISTNLFAQTSITSSGASENFDAMGIGTTLPVNWKLSAPGKSGAVAWSDAGNVTSTIQQASSGTPTTGESYNWGTSGGSDRAVGFMNSGSYLPGNIILAHFTNTTGRILTSITVSFQVERYRINTSPAAVIPMYSTDGSNWTVSNDGSINTGVITTAASAYIFANPTSITRTFTVSGLSIANNGNFYLSWLFSNSDPANSQGLGLDNVSLSVPFLTANLGDNLVDANASGTANPSETIIYRDTIKNIGSADATGVTLTNPAPTGTTYTANSLSTSALARDDSYSFNTGTSTGNVLDNDYGLKDGVTSLTVVSPGTKATAQGGSVTIASDGSFSYTPALAFTGTDQFTYIATTGVAGLPNNDAVVTIMVSSNLAFTTTPVNPTCNGGSNGTITVNASGGTAPYQYSLNSGAYSTTNPLTGLTAGSYTVSVKDARDYTTPASTVTLTNPLAIAVSGTTTIALTYNTAMATVTYTQSNGSGSPANPWSATGLPAGVSINSATGAVTGTPSVTGTFSAVITYTDANGCTGSRNVTVTVAPNLSNDSYTAIGNTQLVADGHPAPVTPHTTSATNILTNDASNATITVTAGTFATTNGGSITIDAAGKFTYTPNVGSTTADSYTYTATSNGIPATATINFTVSNMVWYVQGGAAAGDGRSHSPRNSLPSGSLGTTGNFIYVQKETGVATSTPGGITLLASQQLIGAGTTLNVPTVTPLLTITGNTANTPTLAGTVTLANSVTVNGIDMSTTTATAITNNATTVTGINITVRNLTTTTGTGLSITGTGNTGSIAITSVTTGAAVNSINVNNFASPGTVTINGATITGTTGTAVNFASVTSASLGTTSINQTTQTALALNATPVTLTGNLTIATSAGGTGVNFGGGNASIAAGTNAFSVTNTSTGTGITATAGTIFITGSNNSISTQAGTALSIANTTIAANGLTFSNISANGAANGLNLSGVTGTGNISINGGTLTGGAGAAFNASATGVNITYAGTITQGTNLQPAVNIINTTSSRTIAFSGAITSSGTSSGINLTTNTGTTINFTGGLNLSTGSTASFTATGGGTVNVSGTNSITTTTGRGLFIENTNTGTGITFASIMSTSGQVASISTSTGTKTLGRIVTSSGTTQSLSLIDAGTVNVGSSTAPSSLQTTTNTVMVLTGTTLNIIGTTTNNLAVTATTSGIGVGIGGGTVSITGGNLNITTNTGIGFSAIQGGTLSVTGSNNTINTTAGTALNVTNTSIGASGLTFKSVSSNGGANGIILDNTGTTAGIHGGLTITGDGSNTTLGGNSSGGTISNKSGADGSLTTGLGIYLSNTRDIQLNRITINGTNQNWGLRGATVTNFTMAYSTVSGTNGTSNFYNEGSVYFTQLAGTASVSNSIIQGGFEDNFNLANSTVTLNRIVFSSVTLGGSGDASNDDLFIEASGGTTNVTIQNCTFTSAAGDLFQHNIIGTGVSDLILQNNTFSNNHPAISGGGGGVTISIGASGDLTYNITGNSFKDSKGTALLVAKAFGGLPGDGTVVGKIENNTIGVTGVSNSGSREGSGIQVSVLGKGLHTSVIKGNTIKGYNNYGILVQAGGSATSVTGLSAHDAALNVTIQANIIADPGTLGSFDMNGIHLNAGTNSPDAYQICLDIGSSTDASLRNTITGSGRNVTASTGTDFRLRQRILSTVKMPGYTSTNNDDAAVVNYIKNRNNNTASTTGLASNNVSGGAPGFTNTPGGAACAQ
jgi:hypothetical protein